MYQDIVKEIRKSDEKEALNREFPGKSCGNTECEELCMEVLKIAKETNVVPNILIYNALLHRICPKYGCRKVASFADYPNKGKPIPGCRFGYTYGSHPDKTDAQLEAQLKGNVNKAYDRYHSELRQGKGHSVQFHVTGSPALPKVLGGSTAFNGINDLVTQLEKKYPSHSIEHLIISNHSGDGGFFPTNKSRIEQVRDLQFKGNTKLLERFKKMLTENAILELRMCRGGEDGRGSSTAQDIANTIGCRVIVYKNKVNPAGGKAPYTFLLPGKKVYSPQIEK